MSSLSCCWSVKRNMFRGMNHTVESHFAYRFSGKDVKKITNRTQRTLQGYTGSSCWCNILKCGSFTTWNETQMVSKNDHLAISINIIGFSFVFTPKKCVKCKSFTVLCLPCHWGESICLSCKTIQLQKILFQCWKNYVNIEGIRFWKVWDCWLWPCIVIFSKEIQKSQK